MSHSGIWLQHCELLSRLNITDFDAAAYITRYANNASAIPNIGIAVSGGGYRALMNGGGALQAFDSRTESATAQGHLGGLLQSSTYLAGLSGGGWLLGSIYINNFTTVTRSHTTEYFTDSRPELVNRAQMLLERTQAGERPVRLLGVGAHTLKTAEPPSP